MIPDTTSTRPGREAIAQMMRDRPKTDATPRELAAVAEGDVNWAWLERRVKMERGGGGLTPTRK
jgi:hypothetical protein